MIQLRPVEVAARGCDSAPAVVFEVPYSPALSVEVAGEHAASIRAAFRGGKASLSLFELWSVPILLWDGPLTEVIVEVREDQSFFSVVFISGGLIWRLPVDPVDALLIGFRLDLPFFMEEPSRPEQLPLLVAPSSDMAGAKATWLKSHAYLADTWDGFAQLNTEDRSTR